MGGWVYIHEARGRSLGKVFLKLEEECVWCCVYKWAGLATNQWTAVIRRKGRAKVIPPPPPEDRSI